MADTPNTHAQAPVPPGGAPAPQPATPTPAATNSLAIASLVCGIAAFLLGAVFIGGALGIAAIILGLVGMKKPGGKTMSIIGIILGVLGIVSTIGMILLFVLIGLAGKNMDKARQQANDNLRQSSSTAKVDFVRGETAQFASLKTTATITQRNFQVPAGSISAAEAGKELIVVNISTENTSTQPVSVSPYDFKITTANGVSYNTAFVVPPAPKYDSAQLNPGAKMSGNLVFEVPKGAEGLKLSYGTFATPTAATQTTYTLGL